MSALQHSASWKFDVTLLMKFSSLAAPDVVIMTSGAAREEFFFQNDETTVPFQ